MKKIIKKLLGKDVPAAIPLSESRLNGRVSTLTQAWIIDEDVSLGALMKTARALVTSTNHRILVSLDELGQALYTSGHAIDTHDLNAIDEAEIATLPPACFDDGGYLTYFTTPEEFPFRLRNLARAEAQVDWTSLHTSQHWADQTGNTITEVTADPARVINAPFLIQSVPVQHGWEVLAALPNGYFAQDWTPFQTRALARHLEETHGAVLCGIGASWLAFDLATVRNRNALAADICALYEAPLDAPESLTKALATAPFAMLRYTE